MPSLQKLVKLYYANVQRFEWPTRLQITHIVSLVRSVVLAWPCFERGVWLPINEGDAGCKATDMRGSGLKIIDMKF